MTISLFYFMSIVVSLYVPDKDLEDVLQLPGVLLCHQQHHKDFLHDW
jgi:hypothetical protein